MLKLAVIKNILFLSLCVHIAAAIFSSGFHHFDEHFQIFEFIALKLGQTSANDLPWEFKNQIRPWFQPFSYLMFYNFLKLFGITSPVTMATLIRLLTSLLAWCSLVMLGKAAKQWFKTERSYTTAIFLLHFSWFVPYIHARTSS